MTRRHILLSLAATSLLALCAGCASLPSPGSYFGGYTVQDFASTRKFDSHVHLNVDDPAMAEIARADGFELLSINVDYPDFAPLADQATVAHKYHDADPKHFHFATTFSMAGFGQPDWAGKTNAHLDEEFARGAVAVKIWKNVGMVEKDAAGKFINLDDPGFDPVITHIEAAGKVLINHQGEPRNCWLPMDQMTSKNDQAYFSAHPDYYMYLHPDLPRYEDLMAVRDRFVSHHPGLKFVGAHFASLEWSVDEAAKFLDGHPNANLELAARIGQIQYQSVRDYAKVRAFFIKYQDRIMYGTDLTMNPGDDPAAFKASAHEVWVSDWTYLVTDETRHVDVIGEDVKGLALPKSVIDKIYYGNARREYFGD